MRTRNPTSGRQTAADRATLHVEREVDLRRVKPGDKLPSATQLASDIGVNRAAVLQAFQRLQTEGLLDVRPGRAGTTVIGMQERPREQRIARALTRKESFEGLFPLVDSVESGVARQAAINGLTTEQLTRARAAAADLKVANDHDSLIGAEQRILDVLAEATGSKVMEIMLVSFRHIKVIGIDAVEISQAQMRLIAKNRIALLNAVEARKASRAADLAYTESARTATAVLEFLQKTVGERQTREAS